MPASPLRRPRIGPCRDQVLSLRLHQRTWHSTSDPTAHKSQVPIKEDINGEEKAIAVTTRKMIPNPPPTAVINATLPTILSPKPNPTQRNPLDVGNHHIVDAATTTTLMMTTLANTALLETITTLLLPLLLLLLLAPPDHPAPPVPTPPSSSPTASTKKADLSRNAATMPSPISSKISSPARGLAGSISRKSLVGVMMMMPGKRGEDGDFFFGSLSCW